MCGTCENELFEDSTARFNANRVKEVKKDGNRYAGRREFFENRAYRRYKRVPLKKEQMEDEVKNIIRDRDESGDCD